MVVKAATSAGEDSGWMQTQTQRQRQQRSVLPKGAIIALLALCIAPIVALFSVGAWLGRDCVTQGRSSGDAGPNFVWRIETEQCGNGPVVTNVLVAPRGKTLALAASSTGQPRPISVHREADGRTFVILEGSTKKPSQAVVLPLKVSGRPATPLVLANGQPRS